ncbi:GspE/PulE family protein [Methylibium rhizosphaerae]|uniref:GspE/PulE family protein n=1 Tax=Methylibium rhizosphaerae TaxID=2570323 RepID=UPI00112C1FFA|nr:ATPase, T2SS/T4P/T4SS family [Methylibium rhizosphaerae]
MSDLSPQPLMWTFRKPEGAEPEKARHASYRWPTPPFASYPAAQEQRMAEACEIEGLNGKLTRGRLIFFVPDEGVAHVQVPPARTTLPLRFSQFRQITITEPLEPGGGPRGGDPHADMLGHRPVSTFRVLLAGGGELAGQTIGHVEADFGLFLFPPADDGLSGRIQRMFVPRENYTSFELGPRIGEMLVQAQAATPEQVEQAVDMQQQLRSQKLGDILVTRHVVSPEQLLAAIEQQSRMPMVRIGEALIAMELITQAQLDDALAEQKRDRSVPLGELLVRLKLVSRNDLQAALARKMGYPVVDLKHFPIEPEALRKVVYAMAARLKVLPLLVRDGSLVVAMEDPGARVTIDELEFASQMKIVPVLARHGSIDEAVRGAYEKIGADVSGRFNLNLAAPIEFTPVDSNELVASLEKENEANSVQLEEDRQIEQSDNSLVRLINQMIIEAHTQGVSDIHIESYPGRDKMKIRFRKDGILRPHLELPHNYRSAAIARVKIMADLDISERRKPQDGKINFAKISPQHKIELRVATIPTANGLEDVVMRILASAKPLPMDKLGLSPYNLANLKQAMERPYGMVLCVGPTGSGKTTTLHSALSHINVPERKIWTAEDPVEITQPGLRQVQVNAKIDWTFAKALRAFLRADPDVIMVGEMRDQETASMGIEASLTGHLVLSTLHTNSAPETVTRLLDMGMDPFNFADSLLVVLAQRLVRRLCSHCTVAREATTDEVDELMADWLHVCPPGDARFSRDAVMKEWLERFGRDGRLMHFHGPGCEKCGHTGHKGRAGLHELMAISRELRRLIQTGARAEELQQTALREGMRTLRQDGIEKVLMGVTSIEEVRATSNV